MTNQDQEKYTKIDMTILVLVTPARWGMDMISAVWIMESWHWTVRIISFVAPWDVWQVSCPPWREFNYSIGHSLQKLAPTSSIDMGDYLV